MNWLAFAILAWLAIGLETGLKDVLALRPGAYAIAPSFIVPLAVVIALGAPAQAPMGACLILGLLLDLTAPIPTAAGPAGGLLTVAGPHALGLVLAGQLVLALRGLMIRRNPLAMAFLCIAAAAAMHITVTAIFTFRGVSAGSGPGGGWDAAGQLLSRLGAALYTGASGLVLAFILLPLAPIMGFAGAQPRHIPMRSFARR